MVTTHDSKCWDLAWDFLNDEGWFQSLPSADRQDLNTRLANEIQATIEDFIATKGEFSTP